MFTRTPVPATFGARRITPVNSGARTPNSGASHIWARRITPIRRTCLTEAVYVSPACLGRWNVAGRFDSRARDRVDAVRHLPSRRDPGTSWLDQPIHSSSPPWDFLAAHLPLVDLSDAFTRIDVEEQSHWRGPAGPACACGSGGGAGVAQAVWDFSPCRDRTERDSPGARRISPRPTAEGRSYNV